MGLNLEQGNIWLINLDPTVGREVRGTRPSLIISVQEFNEGPTDLLIVLSITSIKKHTPFHIEINPPEGGVRKKSFIKCEDIRSIFKNRLIKHWGKVNSSLLDEIKDKIKILIDF